MLWWKKLNKSTPESEKEFSDRFKEAGVTWKDKFAMIIAAFITLFIPACLILAALVLFTMWLFGAL